VITEFYGILTFFKSQNLQFIADRSIDHKDGRNNIQSPKNFTLYSGFKINEKTEQNDQKRLRATVNLYWL